MTDTVECPYCHCDLGKGHSCPGAKEDNIKFGKDFFYGKITKAPVGASGVNTGSSKNYKSIITWALKELGWDTSGWTHERRVLNRLIKLAEQRGYEKGSAKVGQIKREAYQRGFTDALETKELKDGERVGSIIASVAPFDMDRFKKSAQAAKETFINEYGGQG